MYLRSFTQTNQTQFLDPTNAQDLPAIIEGMRKVCALESSLLGGAATADGEATPTSSVASHPTSTSAATPIRRGALFASTAVVILRYALVSVLDLSS
jgi:hypothetical protein